jgi:uncharacterized iron-regulated protein
MFNNTVQKIYENLKKLDTTEIDDIAKSYDYQWDENKSTSTNLIELAEIMFNRES